MAHPLYLRPITPGTVVDLFEQAVAGIAPEDYYPGALVALVRLVEAELQGQLIESQERSRRHAQQRRAARRAMAE